MQMIKHIVVVILICGGN